MQQLALGASAAIAILAAPATAAAQVEVFEARTTLFSQTGRGYQSLDGVDGDPGDQQALIVEPKLFVRLRQTDEVVHEAALEVDIVSAASPDAIDATTSASRVNESVALDVTHRYSLDQQGEMFMRWGVHVEEPLRSTFMGAGYSRKLADDNFTIAASGHYSWDSFDAYGPYGDRPGLCNRYTGNGNLSVSQVLSPTTILDLAYGYTYQEGVLETTWNATPTEDGSIDREQVPDARSRHAVTARVSQHLPGSKTTGKLSYRLYHDDFGVDAHTAQLWLYQYLKPWVYGRAGWRVHRQDGADFYRDIHDDDHELFVTSDSDLAPFTSNELTAKLVVLSDRAPFRVLGRATVELSMGRYWRSNDLQIFWSSLSLGYKF